jgi:hypothetical protein
MLAACIASVLFVLHSAKPEMGTAIAIDGSDLPAYASGQRYVKRRGELCKRFADPDASWDHRYDTSLEPWWDFARWVSPLIASSRKASTTWIHFTVYPLQSKLTTGAYDLNPGLIIGPKESLAAKWTNSFSLAADEIQFLEENTVASGNVSKDSPPVKLAERVTGIRHGPGVFVLCDRLFFMPVSVVSVEREYALVVAAVVAAGVGDVREAGAAEGAGDQVADGGIGVRLAPGADLLEVFAEGLVPDIVDWASQCSFTGRGWLEQSVLGGG